MNTKRLNLKATGRAIFLLGEFHIKIRLKFRYRFEIERTVWYLWSWKFRDKRNQKFKICGRGNIPDRDVKNEKKVDSLTQWPSYIKVIMFLSFCQFFQFRHGTHFQFHYSPVFSPHFDIIIGLLTSLYSLHHLFTFLPFFGISRIFVSLFWKILLNLLFIMDVKLKN